MERRIPLTELDSSMLALVKNCLKLEDINSTDKLINSIINSKSIETETFSKIQVISDIVRTIRCVKYMVDTNAFDVAFPILQHLMHHLSGDDAAQGLLFSDEFMLDFSKNYKDFSNILKNISKVNGVFNVATRSFQTISTSEVFRKYNNSIAFIMMQGVLMKEFNKVVVFDNFRTSIDLVAAIENSLQEMIAFESRK